MKRFLPVFALILLTSSAFAQSPSPRDPAMPETVSVAGTGRSTLAPDRVTFAVGVQTVAATVDAAVNENNRKVAAVVAALKRAGATDADIQTSNFSIYPQQDYQQGRLPQILGYQVNNNVMVRRSNVSDAGRLLQAAVSAGVNTSSGLNFEVSNPAAGREQGMRAAFDDARAKATLLAQAAGRTLGRALSITEGLQAQPPMPYAAGRAAAMEAKVASEVPVESGTQELTFHVSVIFELR